MVSINAQIARHKALMAQGYMWFVAYVLDEHGDVMPFDVLGLNVEDARTTLEAEDIQVVDVYSIH